MKVKSTPIIGKGRGKRLGYPTINLKIPKNFKLNHGIFGAKVKIGNKDFIGAVHFGPIPVFKESKPSLEVFLLDVKEIYVNKDDFVILEDLKPLRPIMNFEKKEDLILQIKNDITAIERIFPKE